MAKLIADTAETMHLDALELRNFYYRTGLGRVAQRSLRQSFLELWPEAQGQTVVGFGFPAPLLRPYLGTARRIVALMPGQQGVMSWPRGEANVSVLCEETQWPLPTGIADKLFLLHGLETTDYPSELLEECWRVLGAGGRAIFVVPNRSGMWSRTDSTPFGFGRPYSLRQLESQLKRHAFTPERYVTSLYTPPSPQRFWLRTSDFWEGTGRRLSSVFSGGVHIVEASKQVYAPTRPGLRQIVRRPLRVLEGATQPGPVAGAEPA